MRVWAGIEFQSTLPRRSDDFGWNVHHSCFISIHAPAKERLHPVPTAPLSVPVSIHAPAKERQKVAIVSVRSQGFNPRSREGATKVNGAKGGRPSVSIHAPAKERLTCSVKAISSWLVSIHAPAKERRSLWTNRG